MVFGLDNEYVKRNSILNINQDTNSTMNDNSDNSGDKILYWIVSGVIPLYRIAFGTLQYPVLSKFHI